MNTSDRPRNLLLYEVAASDAWPLMGVKDFDEFNSRLLVRRSRDCAADDRRAGAHAAAARQTAGIDLRNPVGGEEILLHPRGVILERARAATRARLRSTRTRQTNNDKKANGGNDDGDDSR